MRGAPGSRGFAGLGNGLCRSSTPHQCCDGPLVPEQALQGPEPSAGSYSRSRALVGSHRARDRSSSPQKRLVCNMDLATDVCLPFREHSAQLVRRSVGGMLTLFGRGPLCMRTGPGHHSGSGACVVGRAPAACLIMNNHWTGF